jgi:phosphoserine phosphatase RsbU/P
MDAVCATRGLVMTIEPTGLEVKAVKGTRFDISNSVRRRVIQERSSLLVMDALDDSGLRDSASIMAQQIRSLIAVPLQTREQVIGLIYVDTMDVLHPFTREDLELLTVMANIAAIRIEQARLIEVEQAERVHNHELAQAAEIQAQMLPLAPPTVPGLDMFGRNLPCRTVGGDYFDYFEYAGDKVAVLVGDVSGKGMPAAFLMSSLHARLNVLSEAGLGARDLVTRVNAGLCSKSLASRFITFFFCSIDPVTGELIYCNAGHNPPLLVRADGSVEMLDGGGGFPLGMFAKAQYEEARITFGPGDSLMLYSDGLTEACPLGIDEEFGEERLAEFTRTCVTEPAEATVNKLIDHVRKWTAGAPFADDLTVVCVKRRAARD